MLQNLLPEFEKIPPFQEESPWPFRGLVYHKYPSVQKITALLNNSHLVVKLQELTRDNAVLTYIRLMAF